MSANQFKSKVAIVTGGASGLGREIGRQLVEAGAIVVLADIEEAVLDGATAVRVDVTDSRSVESLIESTLAAHGRIDYLFNNAGVAVLGEIRDLSLEHWRRVIEVNLFGEINCIHHVYPAMIRQRFGHIVNTASGFGMAPGPINSPYVASKFAIYGLSHALAAEAREFGISVSIVCPGYIETPMVEASSPVNADAADTRAQITVRLVPVEQAARKILAGVARKKRVIAFPFYVRMLTFLHRFVPPAFERFAARQVEDFRKIRKDERSLT